MPNAYVSVVMPTFNRASLLPEVLDSLCAQQTCGEFRYELVVVDNASTDNTRSIVSEYIERYPSIVRYVFESVPGDASARNRGIQEAQAEWLAFCDDDQIMSPRWLLELRRVAMQQEACYVTGVVKLDLPESVLAGLGPDARRALREVDESIYGSDIRRLKGHEHAGAGNMLLCRSVFDEVGYFDTTMKSGGSDFDFSIRARRAGNDTWLAPKAVVLHQIPENRLTEEFFHWDAMQAGVLLAYLDVKYKGIARSLARLIARVGQGCLVTLPRLGIARLLGNRNDAADRRIRLYRLRGYVHRFLTLVAPRLFSEETLLRELDFRKGRMVGNVAKQPPIKIEAGSASEGTS